MKIGFNQIINYLMKLSKIAFFIFIALLIYFIIFVLFAPFIGVITEDRPIMKLLCDFQIRCSSSKAAHVCKIDGNDDFVNSKLLTSKSYHGCNESTKGYHQSDKIHYVDIESCECGGLM